MERSVAERLQLGLGLSYRRPRCYQRAGGGESKSRATLFSALPPEELFSYRLLVLGTGRECRAGGDLRGY